MDVRRSVAVYTAGLSTPGVKLTVTLAAPPSIMLPDDGESVSQGALPITAALQLRVPVPVLLRLSVRFTGSSFCSVAALRDGWEMARSGPLVTSKLLLMPVRPPVALAVRMTFAAAVGKVRGPVQTPPTKAAVTPGVRLTGMEPLAAVSVAAPVNVGRVTSSIATARSVTLKGWVIT